LQLITRVLRNQYHDSVVLMLAARELKKLPQVIDAAFMMGTEVNKDLLQQGDLLNTNAKAAQANDLIIAVKSDEGSEDLLDLAEGFLTTHNKVDKSASRESNTLRSVIHSHPEANIAVISVAGAYAAREAREALVSGLNVLLFSDNVSVADELALKRLAVQRGLLLMGPGAGTAIINGVGFGFANQVPRGEIGIVSAAGTGLQEVSTLLANIGLGISQAIGTGGRDLSKSIGGLMFFSAFDALNADPNTKLIILISKPPDKQIVEKLLAKIDDCQKPIVLCMLGAEAPEPMNGNLNFTRTLEECALVAHSIYTKSGVNVSKLIEEVDEKISKQFIPLHESLTPEQKYIRALYSGGTLCYESQVIWQDLLTDPVYSNAPLDKKFLLKDSNISQGHTAIDLGEEEFTVGRPHPMIDNELRIDHIKKEAADPQTAVILLDIVLGYGAHPDPAKELSEAIQTIKRDRPNVIWICSVTGTDADPQNLSNSVSMLKNAGVIVCTSNAQAARLAASLVKE